jgi:hypothetical protein
VQGTGRSTRVVSRTGGTEHAMVIDGYTDEFVCRSSLRKDKQFLRQSSPLPTVVLLKVFIDSMVLQSRSNLVRLPTISF